MDYSLYLVADPTSINQNSLPEAIEQAILGGCTVIQLRSKKLSDSVFYDLAKKVKQITDKYQIPLIINDRIDIAMSIKASGVHVGQSDLPAEVVRKIIGKDMILGVSVATVKEAIKAQMVGADYIGVGAVFNTVTKSDAMSVSIATLKDIKNSVHIPVVAIGGINVANLTNLLDTNIDGIAVVSAILGQRNIMHASHTLKKMLLDVGIGNNL